MRKHSSIIEGLYRVHNRINESYPLGIPTVSEVIKDKDLKILYDYINKKYFSNELPECRLKMAPLAKNFHGKTHVSWDNDKIKDLLITMATINQKNIDSTVNTLAHEMIHVWQYYMYATTGDRKYTDDTYSLFAMGEVNTRGHGTYFKQHMDRLNQLGFNIDISSGVTPEMDLDKYFYGVVFYTKSSEVVFLVSNEDPSKHLDVIIPNVEEKMGEGFYHSYTVFKSKDSQMLLGTRLTKQFLLPKNSYRISYDRDAVDTIVNSKLSTIMDESDPVDKLTKGSNSNVPSSLIQTLQAIHKYRGGSWDSYFKTAILNTPEFKRLGSIVGVRLDGTPDPNNGITQDIIDAVKKDWMDVSDVELKKSLGVSSLVTDIRWEMLQNTPLSSKMLDKINSTYEREFKSRVDIGRFTKILNTAVEDELVKNSKKLAKYLGGSVDTAVHDKVSNYFKGTLFEIK